MLFLACTQVSVLKLIQALSVLGSVKSFLSLIQRTGTPPDLQRVCIHVKSVAHPFAVLWAGQYPGQYDCDTLFSGRQAAVRGCLEPDTSLSNSVSGERISENSVEELTDSWGVLYAA